MNGAGAVLAGVKFRFLEEGANGLSVSTYPQIQFHPFYSAKDPRLAPTGVTVFLPLEASKTIGSFELNPEVGVLVGTGIPTHFQAGIVLAAEQFKPLEPLLEVHDDTLLDGTGSELLVNVGGRLSILRWLNLIVALGHTLTSVGGAATSVVGYVGAQLEL